MLSTIGQFVGIAAATLAIGTVALRSRPAKWLWRRNVTEPIKDSAETLVTKVVTQAISESITPLADRMAAVERRQHELDGEINALRLEIAGPGEAI